MLQPQAAGPKNPNPPLPNHNQAVLHAERLRAPYIAIVSLTTFCVLRKVAEIIELLRNPPKNPTSLTPVVCRYAYDFWMNALTFYQERTHWILEYVQERMYLIQSAATCVSLVWLLFRAWQVLWKPVPELISILGIEVPDSPEVSLAGIKPDAITLHWLRPEADKPVVKYLIQVNGVNVGESGKTETAITVTGLKPGNFYNVRVIAVGGSNFQAGSRVIRLRTYDKKGRPILHSGPAPTYDEDSESDNDASKRRVPTVAVEAVSIPEVSHAMAREQSSGGHASQRRNTVQRKHSPSIVAADQSLSKANHGSNELGENMQQLTERFERIRKETEDIQAEMLKDEEEFKISMAALNTERDEKKKLLKEKEENSEKLKKDAANAERFNRIAQNKKSAREKVLKEKTAEREKMHADMIRWKKEVDAMVAERAVWAEEAETYEKEKATEADTLKEQIQTDTDVINDLDEQIRMKGLQIKALEARRINLPLRPDDEEGQAQAVRDRQEDHDWEMTERNLVHQLSVHSQQLRDIGTSLHQAQAHLTTLQANTPIMYQHGNSSGVDFDPSGQGKTKSRRNRNRKSRTSPIASPGPGYSMNDQSFPGAYNNAHNPHSPTFAPGPYIDMSNDTGMAPMGQMAGMSDEEIRSLTSNAPLSPTVATSLLPSNIFADDDHGFGPALNDRNSFFHDNDPQSPSSSSRSASFISSPQNSSHNLALYGVSSPDFSNENDRNSMTSPRADFGAIGSPPPTNSTTSHRASLRGMFPFPRARGKTMQDESPAFGSLKQGQSQSLPKTAEEPEPVMKGHRRTSFSATNFLGLGKSTGEPSTDGNAPAPARDGGARRRRGFNLFSSSTDQTSIYTERDPSSPRPLSIASSDLPRPSSDSAPFGWAPAPDTVLNRNSPLATNWSVHAPQTWSRNPSRRPSLQQNLTNALASGVASEDDEFLPPADALGGPTSPPPVGVIGAPRPASSQKQITPKLNPAAPAFKGAFGLNFNRATKIDRDKDKSKSKSKDKSSSTDDPVQAPSTTSPSASRQSRDSHSIHTQTSTAESYESLEQSVSNSPSDINTPSAKDKEGSTIQRLLRKGSSSKFSISSFRTKEGSLFGGKKSTGSDRNASAERDGSFDEGREDIGAGLGRSVDSVTSSPMVGSIGSGSDWRGRDKEAGSGTPKEGRMSVNWGRFGIKGKKGRESLDVERSETETTEDEA